MLRNSKWSSLYQGSIYQSSNEDILICVPCNLRGRRGAVLCNCKMMNILFERKDSINNYILALSGCPFIKPARWHAYSASVSSSLLVTIVNCEQFHVQVESNFTTKLLFHSFYYFSLWSASYCNVIIDRRCYLLILLLICTF